jgi:taurine dioxygenase
LTDAQFTSIRDAFHDHGVLFFRDQNLSPEDHIEFAKRWGEININRFFTPLAGYPQIAEVRKEAEQTLNIGGDWHTDHSYDLEPALGSILCARELPATGGDTLFASMGAAFDAFSADFQKLLETLTALHSSRHVFGNESSHADAAGERLGNAELATQDVHHPVVIRHPATHRKCLYVNPGFTRSIDGWGTQESEYLLNYLYAHAAQPRFSTRFQWTSGSVAMWDNRSTWHCAINDYQGQRRYMHRITIAGVALH